MRSRFEINNEIEIRGEQKKSRFEIKIEIKMRYLLLTLNKIETSLNEPFLIMIFCFVKKLLIEMLKT